MSISITLNTIFLILCKYSIKNTTTMRRFCIALLTLLSLNNVLFATDSMPIIAFMGVPDNRTTEENFRIMSECGFNVSIYPYANLDMMVKACRIADKYGVKILSHCPEMDKNPTLAASILKKEKGFFGYSMQDEPTVPDIHQRQQEIEKLKSIDNTHVFYINLQPFYNPDWVEPSTKAKDYPTYLKAASATSCQQISFDFYPITTTGIRPTWYHNLEMIRQESLSSGKPFWAFVLSVAHDVPYTANTYYPIPTLASLRLQIYVNLAYGAQAIQYFTYWNSDEGGGTYHYHSAPISGVGKKTNTYYLVQQMNHELKQVAKLFYGAKVTSVKHMKIIPQGCSKQDSIPLNLKSLKIVSSKGAIVSQFYKNNHLYMAIVNKNHLDPMTVLIRAKNNTPKHVTKSLQEETMKTSYNVPAGDLLLFRLK